MLNIRMPDSFRRAGLDWEEDNSVLSKQIICLVFLHGMQRVSSTAGARKALAIGMTLNPTVPMKKVFRDIYSAAIMEIRKRKK